MSEIGRKYGKSVGQVIVSWSRQRVVMALAKLIRKERMEENLHVFDFELSTEDMAKIATLDTGKSLIINQHNPNVVEWRMGNN